MSGQNGADRDKSVELVYGGAAAADQPTEGDVGDIVARAKSALEDSYHVLHGSELVAELADEVERLRAVLDEARTYASGQTSDLTVHLMKRHEAEAGRDQLKAAVERVREALDRVVLDHRYTGEPTSPGYQGAADYIRAALDGEGDPS